MIGKQNSENLPKSEIKAHVKVIKDQGLRVTLVGSMNVGKSTLFNMLMDERIPNYHFVANHEGTTRDTTEAKAKLHDIEFIIIDTPGMIQSELSDESVQSIQSSDLVIFMVSAISGIGRDEINGAKFIRSCGIPTLLVINKVDMVGDVDNYPREVYEQMGFGDPIYLSLNKRSGIDDLYHSILPTFEIEKMQRQLNDLDLEDAAVLGDEKAINLIEQRNSLDRYIRVAIIGRANTGKSTLINTITGSRVARDSKMPHMTRDTIETKCIYQGRKLKLVDTPSFLRVRHFRDRPFQQKLWMRTRSALRFSNVCIIVFDATQGCPGKGDMILAYKCIEEGKAFTFAANKWDLISDGASIAEAIDYKMRKQLHEVKYCSAVATSAVSGLNVLLLLEHILTLNDTWNKHITSNRLTRFWRRIEKSVSLPHHITRVRRLVQVNTRPPTFVLQLQTRNELKKLPFTYEAMIKNHLVEEFGFHGVPIRMFQEIKDSYKDFF